MSEVSKISLYRDKLNAKSFSAEVNDEIFSIEYMKSYISEIAEKKNMLNSLRALEVMEKYHSGAYRKGREHVAYIVHPLLVACHAFSLGIEDDIIIPVCLLHDVLEDSDATADDLDMPDDIVEAVRLLSFDKNTAEKRDDAKTYYFESIAGNRVASVVKVLDRCNNISNMTKAFSKEKMLEYIAETEKYILPLLEMLKDEYGEKEDVVFLLKYHMISMLDSLKQALY